MTSTNIQEAVIHNAVVASKSIHRMSYALNDALARFEQAVISGTTRAQAEQWERYTTLLKAMNNCMTQLNVFTNIEGS